ncbi:hypothetical protein B0H34DRAFT_730017 [Crassisporium funariophilum]|nr:hypothetical protein B0H34DRAFT_730017 [Crassisporium funariophilum]
MKPQRRSHTHPFTLQDTKNQNSYRNSYFRSRSPSLRSQPSSSRSSSFSRLTNSTSIRDGARKSMQEDASGLALEDSFAWKWHPIYGIIHNTGCDVCAQYVTHTVEAEDQTDFQDAQKERDKQRDLCYSDGVSEGRRLQRMDANILAAEYRQRFSVGRDNMEVALIESHRQNQALREELETYRIQPRNTPAVGDRSPASQGRVALGERGRVESATHITMSVSSDPSFASSSIYGILPEEHSQSVSSSGYEGNVSPMLLPREGGESNMLKPAASPGILNTYAAAASARVPSSTLRLSPHSNSLIYGRQIRGLPSRPSGPPPQSPSTDSRVAAARFAHSGTPEPRTLDDLRTLMNAARTPGNDAALAKVKALCKEAHETARDSKTELQKFLLYNWRNSGPTDSSQSSSSASSWRVRSAPKLNPRIDDSVEIWYDYLCVHQGSWPRGVRKDSQNRPVIEDLRASRIISQLRPRGNSVPNTASARAEYMIHVVGLFSSSGTYGDIVSRNNWNIAQKASYNPYPGPVPITLDNVARHFAMCGVVIGTVTQELEQWVRNYIADGLTDVHTKFNQHREPLQVGTSSNRGIPHDTGKTVNPRSQRW